MSADAVVVRGSATHEELAVVLALVSGARRAVLDGYPRWRETRLAAMTSETSRKPILLR